MPLSWNFYKDFLIISNATVLTIYNSPIGTPTYFHNQTAGPLLLILQQTYFVILIRCILHLSPADPWPSCLQGSCSHQGPKDHQQQSSRGCESHRPGAQRDARVRSQRCDGPGWGRAALRRHMQGVPGVQPRRGTIYFLLLHWENSVFAPALQ